MEMNYEELLERRNKLKKIFTDNMTEGHSYWVEELIDILREKGASNPETLIKYASNVFGIISEKAGMYFLSNTSPF